MWISRKRFQELEKRIADLEKTVQSQQRQITSYFHQLARPESLLKQVVHDAQSDDHIPTFRVNLSSRKLFERKIE